MTVWSNYVNHMRIGLDVWTDALTSGSTHTNVHVRVTVQCDSTWNFADNQTAVLSGSASKSFPYYNGLQRNQTKVVGTHTLANQPVGNGGPNYNFTARIDGIYLGSGPSVSTSFTLPARPAPNTRVPSAPPAPSFADVTATSVNVTWGTPSDHGTSALNGSWLQVGSTNFGNVIYDNQANGWAGRSVGSLVPGTTYYARVAARNAVGWSTWGPVSSFTTSLYTTSMPSVTTTTTSAQVSWEAPTDLPAPLFFQFQVSEDAGFASAETTEGPWTTSRDVNGLAPGRRYYFRVRADAGTGWGAWSGAVEATTQIMAPPEAPPREPGSAYTVIAQRATTGEFLDFDVPMHIEDLEWQLSGPGSLKGSIDPDVGGLRAPDGQPILEEWGTFLFVESGGEIRWGGIVISCSFEGESWSIEAAGFSTYLHGVVYEGEFSQIGVDPAAVFRHIWQHAQSFPDANLGVTVTGASSTPVRIGTPATTPEYDARTKAADEIARRMNGDQPIFEDWTWADCPPEVSQYNDELLGLWNRAIGAQEWLEEFVRTHPHEDAEPYELLWYDHPNLGTEINELTAQTPMDWVERHYWAPDRESIVHEIQLAYPRLGRFRDDLAFIEGDNVSKVLVIDSNGDEFANTIHGLGAGEGRSMLRRSTAERDGRLRRVAVYADKAVTDPARLDALIAQEANVRRSALRITSFTVTDHPNAPLGSWQIGDDVLVRADVPWLGEVSMRVRVLGWSLLDENTAVLTVERSDFYRYGGTQ